MNKIITACAVFSISLLVYAGGNPEYVGFPGAYKSEFTQYDTRNRTNGKQIAVMYANSIAKDSASSSTLAEGSKIIMEVYKTIPGEDGKPTVGEDGLFKKGKFAAIAVMEKRSNWESSFDAKERAGNWGFAIYNTDGTPKDNKLECATCHTPISKSDYLFSYSSLIGN